MGTPTIYRTKDGKWFHHSSSAKATKLRWYVPDGDELKEQRVDHSNSDDKRECDRLLESSSRFTFQQIAALVEDVLSIDVAESANAHSTGLTGLPISRTDDWRAIFQRLTELDSAGQLDGGGHLATHQLVARQHRQDLDLIPQTCLRRFYEVLRMLNSAEIGERIADYLGSQSRSDRLQTMFSESMQHFAHYQNVSEGFRPERKYHSVDKYLRDSTQFAKCLQARLRSTQGTLHSLECDTGSSVSFSFVDYEISPFRTTGHGMFENRKVGSSGGGGVDLLLREEATGIPIIGEIKAATDRDLFLAFIQSLVYAVELATLNQRERLAKVYPSAFGDTDSATQVGIYLIYEDTCDPRLLTETRRLADDLMAKADSPVGRTVRCVRFVETGSDGAGDFAFRCFHTSKAVES